MFTEQLYTGSKEENERLLLKQLEGLIEDEPSQLANLANASALLQQFLSDINWVGFYLLDGEELVLGPFQGKPACTRIKVGRGVCGTAVSRGEAVLVEDVHQFPGHIACDSASNSELVIPLKRDGAVIGVLDIDSPLFSRFDETDLATLTAFVNILEKYL
ncbi:GAF domain-containing protein [Paenibacillus algorifonticola]|uniref:GAF domain-containing protein n=1 Tax=Paenibacillus algorifonticola TaxID=684063 RepID=A0A1I2EUV1_9BACL|nr:GAF domain-containing protein [Paenibacillus algorifonticola]SFE96236.1 GAF domain-containing protein [Paenibacillus algorifonticola]